MSQISEKMDPSKASETLLEQNPLSLSNKVPDGGTFAEDGLGDQVVLSPHTQHQQVPALVTQGCPTLFCQGVCFPSSPAPAGVRQQHQSDPIPRWLSQFASCAEILLEPIQSCVQQNMEATALSVSIRKGNFSGPRN